MYDFYMFYILFYFYLNFDFLRNHYHQNTQSLSESMVLFALISDLSQKLLNDTVNQSTFK